MIYLILSILSSTVIFVFFKLFSKYKVNTLQAIVVNYFTAFICGLLLYKGDIKISYILDSDWLYVAIGLGLLFITIFNIMALTAQKNGLSVVSVATKMSVIIPVLFGIYVYNESAGYQKIIGILLALIAVILTALKPKDKAVISKFSYLPILLFLGSGIIDTSVNHFAPKDNLTLFLSIIFAMAGLAGIFILLFKHINQKISLKANSLPFGIALGIVNYCSLYFLLKALQVEGNESSTIFTINNVAIIAISTLTGLVLFKERISIKNWIGVAIALISIILVTL
ncbi:EamA family transporter [Winogradskyella pulchriflava]|uniref:EamA family transporter n=1 Tax=Winogradskyella pulchriflava TaxID=1110688 RepID=A0ABV6Q8E8_9FLAO